MRHRVAFCGQARSGKSTASDFLVKHHQYKELCFATPLYDIMYYAQSVCGFPKTKDRFFLQTVGTEYARERDADVWVKLMRKRIESMPSDSKLIVSDLRFMNEYEELRRQNFVIIKIVRDSAVEDQTFGNGSRNHKSEMDLDALQDSDFDFVLSNNESIEEFTAKIHNIVSNKSI